MQLAFAIVQWGIVLPVQVYLVWRAWRNWKASERELLEACELGRQMREAYTDALRAIEPWQPPDDPPTVQ